MSGKVQHSCSSTLMYDETAGWRNQDLLQGWRQVKLIRSGESVWKAIKKEARHLCTGSTTAMPHLKRIRGL
eukprot:376764-Pelagomonas_calceolata.AAC.6